MKDVIIYKGFVGSVHFSTDDNVFHGKVEGINDLVTFEGESVAKLRKAFYDAVEDYIELCKQAGKEPVKSCKGSFNVRVTPQLHIQATLKASKLGISLNQFIKAAIEKEIADNTCM